MTGTQVYNSPWEVHQALILAENANPCLRGNALWKQHREDAYDDLKRAMGVLP